MPSDARLGQDKVHPGTFVNGWLRCGDQVIRDDDGYIQVVDRIKDAITTGGVLVAPREVEDCIYERKDVAEVAVIGLYDERWGEAITAFVVLEQGLSLTTEAVRPYIKGASRPTK